MKAILTVLTTFIAGLVLGFGITTITPKSENIEQKEASPKTNEKVTVTNVDYQNLPKVQINQEKAIQIFENFYSKSKITEIALKVEHGHYHYIIQGFDDVKDCDLKIDAVTGKIVGQSTLRRENQDNDLTSINFKKIINSEKASQLAVAEVGGGKAISWVIKQNSNYDFPVWIVAIANNNEIVEIKLNAENGKSIE